ncbi:MAG: phosphopantothenoylcysteine decarboxylase [Endomicrobia bacterium]|nr:phosphopantothenoylcysteine decarboxylase [Endomicrobiia bacterium]MCX7941118.1 phosphopantothenoylcysteine decarboxylase [Endomicrobiia bacterium]MDW8055264.1 flavoprotein [Elusimicrobiota bacterium]
MRKNILIGITAGISIYKICELIRQLRKKNYSVKCIMTRNATELISPLLFQELTEEKVYIDMFSNQEFSPTHVALSDWADLIVVAPCSCNTISKLACGKTEDLLTCTIYAADLKKTKVLLCPSMNTNMWLHPITQKNIKTLKDIGYHVLEPEKGELLCNKEGVGRLPEIEKIVRFIEKLLTQ